MAATNDGFEEAPDYLQFYGAPVRTDNSTGLSQKQYGIVYDLLSEGPIEGLVNSAESVTFNGIPLRDKDTNTGQKEIITLGTTSGSPHTTLTVSNNALDGIDESFVGLRYVTIGGAGKAIGSVTFSIAANSTRLVASSSFFTTDMAGFDSGSPDQQLGWTNQVPVEIPGAGANGDSLFATITGFDSSTVVQLDVKAVAGVTASSTVKFGFRCLISSVNVSASQIILAKEPTTSVTNASVIINPPIYENMRDSTGGKWNFSNVSYAFRTGTVDQKPGPDKGSIATNASYLYSPQIQLKRSTKFSGSASPTVVASDTMGLTNASEIDRLKVTFDMPQGLRLVDESNGDDHDSYFEVEVLFEYSNDGGSTYNTVQLAGRRNYTHTSLFNSPKFDATGLQHQGLIYGQFDKRRLEELTFSIEQYQPFTDWRIVVNKVSPEEQTGLDDKFKHIGVITLQTIEAMVTDSLQYPLSAYAVATFGAEDFPRPPVRGYHLRGLKIQVPTNYITREEAGSNQAKYTRNVSTGIDANVEQDWNGAFRGDLSTYSGSSINGRLVYCNNPAWVFYDLCVNQRYGLGKIIEPSLIDKYALYSIARYCDELVPDGKGGKEPRFTCNAYITRQVEAYKLLKDLATVFRGMVYWMNGVVTPVQDAPREPVYTFTQGNVIGGRFSYESTSDRIQKNQIRVTWNDPAANYTQRVELIEDHDDIIQKNRFVPYDVAAFGCTSKGQARRVGLWQVVTSRQETELVKFATGQAGYFIGPGDIIYVQDQQRDSVEFSGRISLESPAATTTTFAIDREITLDASKDYEVFVFFPEPAAYLIQDAVTINSVSYVRGDIILAGFTAGSPSNLVTISSEEMASSIVDDSGEHVRLHWAPEGHLQRKDISNSGTVSHIVVGSAFTSPPKEENIYAIRNKAGGTQEPKQYRVLGTSEDDDGNVNVVASFFYDRKFDAIDFGYATTLTESEEAAPINEAQIPKPTEVALTYVQRILNYGPRLTAEGTNKQTALGRNTRAVLAWSEPLNVVPTETVYQQVGSPAVEAVTQLAQDLSDTDTVIYVEDAQYFSEEGGFIRIGSGDNTEWIKFSGISLGSPKNALTGLTRGVNNTTAKVYEAASTPSVIQYETVSTKYRKLAGYDIEIHGGPYSTPIRRRLSTESTRFTLPGIAGPGIYTAKIRTRNTEGNVSDFVTVTRSLVLTANESNDRIFSLPRGGYCSTTMKIHPITGLLTFHSPDFVFQSVTGNTYEYENVALLSETIDFGSLGQGTTAFLCHHPQDESPLKFTNDFIALEVQHHFGWKFSDEEVSPTLTANQQWLKIVGQSGSPDTFGLTQASGTITISRGSFEVSGSSTSFTTDFSEGDLIRFDTSSTIALNDTAFYGRVANIVNDNTIMLENSIDRAFTNDFVFKQTFKPDFVEDSLVTRVLKDDASRFTLLPFSGTVVGPNAIQAAELAANSVGSVQITSGSVDADVLSEGSITNILISANAIEAANIAAEAINQVHIAANSITNASIQANSIKFAEIAAGSIENLSLAANAIGTANIQAGAIESVNMAANSISSANITAGSINSVMMGANAIESVNISSGAIETVNIAANAITFQEMAANSINSVNIAANAIGIQEIAAGSVDSVKIAANAVAQANIQADAISSVELSTNAVINANIASDSIESANMSAGSVINAAIAVNSIQNQNITAQSVNAIVIAPNALENFHVSVNAITGRNVAEDSIEQAMIAANAIGTAQIAANSIGAAAILANSIGVASIQANAIGTQQIISGSISTLDIAADAITSAKIDAGAVDSAAIAADAITAAKIDAGGVDSAAIAADAITAAKIDAGAIETAAIGANQITTAKIASDQIETAHIKANNITTAKIAANNITTATIAAGAVDTAQIAADAITTAKIDAEAVGTAEIASGAITTAKIQANQITSATIATDAVDTAQIASDAVGTAEINALAVTTAKIAANNITTAKIASNNVTTASIASGNITSALIAANQITTAKIAANNITSLTIASGNIDTLQIADDAVQTVKVQDNAITINTAVQASSTVTINSQTFTDVLSLTWTSTGAPVVAFFNAVWSGTGNAGNFSGSSQFLHGSTLLAGPSLSRDNGGGYESTRFFRLDSPSAGSNTIKIQAKTGTSGTGNNITMSTGCSLFVLETKK